MKVERRAFSRRRARSIEGVAYQEPTTALCARCLVLDKKTRLVLEIERDDDGRWIASRIVHADDTCPPLPVVKEYSGVARHPRHERAVAIRLG